VSLNSEGKLVVVDARGKVAATLNKAVGKGTEDIGLLGDAELVFGNIENIHVMRSSLVALTELLATSSHPLLNSHDLIQHISENNSSFYAKLDETGWLKHLRLILVTSVLIAEKMHLDGASVLIHCSDGWDRTAQLCSTVQLMLDPYYRTIEGFAVLIEKEWCAFGHKFHGELIATIINNIQMIGACFAVA
jgi:hypothetical protein